MIRTVSSALCALLVAGLASLSLATLAQPAHAGDTKAPTVIAECKEKGKELDERRLGTIMRQFSTIADESSKVVEQSEGVYQQGTVARTWTRRSAIHSARVSGSTTTRRTRRRGSSRRDALPGAPLDWSLSVAP